MRTIVLLMTTAAGAALAQERPAGHGYVFFAPGAANGFEVATLHIGVGGEREVRNRIGVGGEIGYAFLPRSFRDGAGLASVNGYYHFLDRRTPWAFDPFVTAGYSVLFGPEGAGSLFNTGAGVNYWCARRFGLRLEVRDHIYPGSGGFQAWGVRVGMAFR